MKIIYVRNLEAIFLTVTPEFFTKIYNLFTFICMFYMRNLEIKQNIEQFMKGGNLTNYRTSYKQI